MAAGGSIATPEQLILYVFSLFRSSQMSLVFLHPFIQSFVLDGNSLLLAGFVVGVMTLVVTFFLVKLHC